MKRKLKSESGITLITLAFAIVIMLVISSILIYNANAGVLTKNLNNMYNDIKLLTDKVNLYYAQYHKLPVLETKYSIPSEIKEKNENDNDTYYVVDLEALENLTLRYGKEYQAFKNGDSSVTDLYIINEQSHTIYYVKGIEFEKKWYYSVPKEDTKIELSTLTTLQVQEVKNNQAILNAKMVNKDKGIKQIEVYVQDTLYQTIPYQDNITQMKSETITISNLPFYEDITVFLKVINQTNEIIQSELVTVKNTSTIHTKEDLIHFAELVNTGVTFEGKTITLENDITLGGTVEPWNPIGINDNTFLGTLDGNHKKITGLYINNTSKSQGFFSRNDGIIKDLTMEGAIIGGNNTGAIAGINYNTIQNCTNKATIQSTIGVSLGGIVGSNQNNGVIYGCTNIGDVTANSIGGGIVGENKGRIQLCYNKGTITAQQTVGGIAGIQAEEEIDSCYNIGKLVGNNNIGGIAGEIQLSSNANKTQSILKNCYHAGSIVTTGQQGGVIGILASGIVTINNNYYLEASAKGGIASSDIAGQAEVKTIEELKILTSILGENYKEDKTNINTGYPILKWQ